MLRNALIVFIAATATAARPHLRRSPLLTAQEPTTAAAEAVHRMVVRDRGGYTIATRFAAAEAAAVTVPKPGDLWWEGVPSESDRSAGLGRYVAACAAWFVSFAAWLGLATYTNRLRWLASVDDFCASPNAPPVVLLGFRLCALALVLAVKLKVWLAPATLYQYETLERAPVRLRIRGLWRSQGLTSWSWLLIGAYFAVAAALQGGAMLRGGGGGGVPTAWANIARVLLGCAWAFSLMVTTVVTFVLIPSKAKKGLDLSMFFSTEALLMHNANVLLMAVELLNNGVALDFYHTPFGIAFGVVYVLWHHLYRYRRTHTLLYFFLSWQSPHALKVLAALVAAFAVFFGLGVLLTEAVRPTAIGAPLTLLLVASIMRLRPPKERQLGADGNPVQMLA